MTATFSSASDVFLFSANYQMLTHETKTINMIYCALKTLDLDHSGPKNYC